MDLNTGLILICGHYGTGKTNLTLNLARDLCRQGRKVTVADMDLVNPYFRSSDHKERLEEWGAALIAPVFARSNVDLPALSPEVYSIFGREGETVLVDAGGDDAGATALGRFSERIQAQPYEMFYVFNHYRPLAGSDRDAAELLREIEAASRLKATGIVNNSHLQSQTTAQTILEALPFAEKTAEALGLPLLCTTAPPDLAEELRDRIPSLYPVDVFVTTPWQEPDR